VLTIIKFISFCLSPSFFSILANYISIVLK
jgi:hypothetical protein